MFDTRSPLPKGAIIHIQAEDTSIPFVIEDVIGCGGSCIVYRSKKESGICDNKFSRTQIIKEFYPLSIHSIVRNGYNLDVPECDCAQFAELEEIFCGSISKYVQYYEIDSNYVNVRPFWYGTANGTSYAVSDPTKGVTLSDLEKDNLTLFNIAQIMYSVCSAIQMFHNQGLLYLDCKPDNIFLCNVDKQYHVQLFDFDTVTSISDIKAGKCVYKTYSQGWAPGEQQSWRIDEIGRETDIYSIGAVFFYLLTGEKPIKNDIRKIIDNKFLWHIRSPILTNASEAAIQTIQRILENALQTASSSRCRDISSLKESFQQLMTLTLGNNIENLPIYVKLEKIHGEVSGTNDRLTRIEEHLNATHKAIQEKEASQPHPEIGKQQSHSLTKQHIVLIVIIAAVAISIVAYFTLNHQALSGITTYGISDESLNEHLLLQLSNANHQYEMGLQNWRRLDYTRADRDIREARDEISTQKSQAELDVASINNSLGCLYLDMGKYQEAYDYLNAAYVTFQDKLGDSSIEARAVRLSIAKYDYYTGNIERALTETQNILDSSNTDTEKVIVVGTSHLRAMIFDAQGNYKDALTLYESVLELYEDILEDGTLAKHLSNYANDPKLNQTEKDYYTNAIRWIALTYDHISQVNLHKGDYEAAFKAAQVGLEMSLNNIYIGRRNLTTSKLYMSLSRAEAHLTSLDDGLDDIDLAMRIQQNLFDFQEVYPGLVEVYSIYGQLLEEKGAPEQALQYYTNAITLSLSSFGDNHPETAGAYAALGNYHLRQNEFTLSIEALEKAIEIRRNILAENHPDTAAMYYSLATAQQNAGMVDAAHSNLLKADNICKKWDISHVQARIDS